MIWKMKTRSCITSMKWIIMASLRKCVLAWIIVIGIWSAGSIVKGTDYSSYEASFERKEGKYLANNVIRQEMVSDEVECSGVCARESSCASVYKTSGENQGLCELNEKTLENSDEKDVENNPWFDNFEIMKRTCGNSSEMFQLKTKQCVPFPKSCKDLLATNGTLIDGVYNLFSSATNQYPVYCRMSNISGCGGGLTLVMKLDGAKSTFGYNSSYWKDTRIYGVQDGLQGLTETQSKLESYWNTPFTKMCVGIKVNGVAKWIKLDYKATSLYSVIADGKFRPTNAGRSAWRSLIDGSSLQQYCNEEGFNVKTWKAYYVYTFIRLGLHANDHNVCLGSNSWIGFGAHFASADPNKPHLYSTITTGNVARFSPGGNRDTSAFGYILVG